MPDTETNIEKRLVELESRLAFQDHIIDELNGVVTSQQEQVDTLEKDLATVHSQLRSILSGPDETDGI